MRMSEIASAAMSVAFHGLTLAMVLYLISVGLSVTMGLMGFVNLAHGAFAMTGGYIMTSLMNRWGVVFPLSLLAAIAVTVAISLVIERLLYRRLYGGRDLDQVLLTMGLIFMSVGAATYIWGPLAQPMQPPELLRGQVDILGHPLPAYRTFLIVCGAIIVTVLWISLERTRFGARLRAAVDNLRMAQTLGINTSRLFATAFALGSGLAALGGGLGAELLAIAPGYALDNLVYFLIVVAVGGLGSIRGPFFAALVVGLADTGLKYFAPELGAFFIYALTMAILLRYPRGIFGQT
jgi:branched-chain amino acid transport system permease protein